MASRLVGGEMFTVAGLEIMEKYWERNGEEGG